MKKTTNQKPLTKNEPERAGKGRKHFYTTANSKKVGRSGDKLHRKAARKTLGLRHG